MPKVISLQLISAREASNKRKYGEAFYFKHAETLERIRERCQKLYELNKYKSVV